MLQMVVCSCQNLLCLCSGCLGAVFPNKLDPGGREVDVHWQVEHLGEDWLCELGISEKGRGKDWVLCSCLSPHSFVMVQHKTFDLKYYICENKTPNLPNYYVQGVPKKMQHSDFSLRSVLEVRFNFFTYVSESEFRARSIWAHYRPPIQNLKCPKTLKMHARTLIFPHPSEVKPELCRLCTSSPIPICVGRHYYSWSTLNWVLYLHCTVICDHQSWKWTENWIISSSKHAK